ncbi:EscU/YscU/HrcU family type III secretion system export apparatus switch protein [Roseovarius autotrophicus]|uniref:EscU/YscU/HrcU family type III secretion system export apparatus switch protein n=1 Tax=Roseovarius autotrophicus TaxID=2824121 RepID=UPI001B398CC7|nr:flagellar type III secretion system protein FlhB [Roseovarius autotrophicus]
MAEGQDEGDKTHEATAQKLEKAREKGDLARSADLNTAGSYAGFVLVALAVGAGSISEAGSLMMRFLDQPDRLAALIFAGGSGASVLGGLMGGIALALLVWFLLPGAGALLVVVAQRSLVFAPSKLEPKLSRINPIENAKNKYGPGGLFEFAKSAVKLLAYCLLLGTYLTGQLPRLAAALHAAPGQIGALMVRMVVEFLAVVLLLALAIGAVDYLWQHFDHARRQRMSHKEIRDEHKENEGDPHMKQKRRQKGMDIAARQMMAEVAGADVVIVNPIHYAVALKWNRLPGAAPVCVAKGVDHMALAIRETAHVHGVPVHRDPPVARALHAETELGREIDPRHYRAVAAAIRFADTMRRKARAFG